jgi:hypothetical protein
MADTKEKKSVDVIFDEIVVHIDGELLTMTNVAKKMMVDSLMIHLRALPKKWNDDLPGSS